jgi:hypothetical protein
MIGTHESGRKTGLQVFELPEGTAILSRQSDPQTHPLLYPPLSCVDFKSFHPYFTHLAPHSKEAGPIESYEAWRAGKSQQAIQFIPPTQSTPCLVHPSTQVSNPRASKEQKRKRRFVPSPFVHKIRSLKRHPTQKGPVVFVTSRFFRSCP